MHSFVNINKSGPMVSSGGVRAVVLAAFLAAGLVPAHAQDLRGSLAEMLKNHPRLQATRNDVSSAQSRSPTPRAAHGHRIWT